MRNKLYILSFLLLIIFCIGCTNSISENINKVFNKEKDKTEGVSKEDDKEKLNENEERSKEVKSLEKIEESKIDPDNITGEYYNIITENDFIDFYKLEKNLDKLDEKYVKSKKQVEENRVLCEYEKDNVIINYDEYLISDHKRLYLQFVKVENPGPKTSKGLEVGMDEVKFKRIYGEGVDMDDYGMDAEGVDLEDENLYRYALERKGVDPWYLTVKINDISRKVEYFYIFSGF